MLAQRAASEGPRWTRAVEDQSAPILEETMSQPGRISWVTRCGIAWDKARCPTFNDYTQRSDERDLMVITSQVQTSEQRELDVQFIADEANAG